MNALHLLLDDELFADACREAAIRAIDVDALIAHVLSGHFARWMSPDDVIADRDPDFDLRLNLAVREAIDREVALASAVQLPGADCGGGPWVDALAAAIADDVRSRIEHLERWQRIFRAGERALVRGLPREAAERFREAVDLASVHRIPAAMTLERLARAELVAGRLEAAAEAARRAMVLAGQSGLPHASALARLTGLVETISRGHPAVQQIVAGLVALEHRQPGAAVERLVAAADAAARDGEALFEMRARGALAVVRLAVGAGRVASREARRAAALARDAALDDLGGLLDVLASAGELDERPPPAGDGQSAGQGSSSMGS